MSLRDTQAEFARALRQPGAVPASDGEPDFAERFDAYRNNAWQFFAAALEQTYPVVQRRVGAEFFRRLVHEYREAHPSRQGDLHWAGADFAPWLQQRLAGSGYDWLADLARLEWAVAEAVVAASAPAAALHELAAFPPESLAGLRVNLHPSVRLVASAYPVWSVWQANQQDDADPVDLAQGAEHCVVACIDERPVLYRIAATDHQVLDRLQQGDALGAALAAADADPEALGRVLGWAYSERLVAAVLSPSAPA